MNVSTTTTSAQQFASVCLLPDQEVRVQRVDAEGDKILPYSRRDYYKVWMVRDTGYLHYATHSVHIQQPALIFSNPLVPYSYESSGYHAYMCIFTEAFMKASSRPEVLQELPVFRIGSRPVFFLSDHQYNTIAVMYEKMLEEMETTYVHRFDVIRNYLNLIIHEGMKMEPTLSAVHHHNASSRIASLFLELLERQFPIDSPARALRLKKASDYADSLSVHVNHLNHAVKEITGKSTTTHIAERIVGEAQALLRHTDLSISDIAFSLGFEYPNYFNNFFKKNTGMTPLALRK